MAYVEWHDTVRNHPKTDALMLALGIKRREAVGIIGCISSWCIQYRPGGRLEKRNVAVAVEWEGDTSKLLAALTPKDDKGKPIGWLDEIDGDWVAVHDWKDITRGYRKARADAARKKRDYRASLHGVSTEKTRDSTDKTSSAPRPDLNDRNGTEQSGEELPPTHAALAPLTTLTTEPTAHDGLVRAFAFCRMPGLQCKRRCIEDLKRQGVDEGRIMAAATDPMNRSLDFFDIMKSLKPERAQRSEWDKAMELLRSKESSTVPHE